jgi:hypothetical protein
MPTIHRPAFAKASAGRSQTFFVGIDVHKDTHTAVGLAPFGEKVFEMTIGNEAGDFISLVEKTKVEAQRVGLVPSFGLEDVHSWGERLSSFLVEEGLPVIAIAPVLVDHRRSKMTHPEKSDSLDAEGVAEVMIQRIDSLPPLQINRGSPKSQANTGIVAGKRVAGEGASQTQKSAPYSTSSDTQQLIPDKIQRPVLLESSAVLEKKHSQKHRRHTGAKNEKKC